MYIDQRHNIPRAKAFNLTLKYIDDVLSINNPNWTNWIQLVYTKITWDKKTTETASSTSFPDICLNFNTKGQLSTRLNDKRNDFNFVIINFHALTVNYQQLPRMEFIYHNSYATFELVVCIQNF